MKDFIQYITAAMLVIDLSTPAMAQQVSQAMEINAQARQASNSGDDVTARRLHEQACNEGSFRSCFSISVLLQQGRGGSVDEASSYGYAVKSCDGGYHEACPQAGAFLAQGKVVPRDIVQARKYFEQGCEAKYAIACQNEGFLAGGGFGQPKDLEKFYFLTTKACQLGSEESCSRIASLDSTGSIALPAQGTLERAELECEFAVTPGCYQIGQAYKRGDWGFDVNARRGSNYFEESCDNGYAEGCAATGTQYYYGTEGYEKDRKLAAQYFGMACETGSGSGCQDLGRAHKNGDFGEPDPQLAYYYSVKSCNLNDARGCWYVARKLESGDGVAQDLEIAYAMYQRACALEDKDSCKAGKKLRRNIDKANNPSVDWGQIIRDYTAAKSLETERVCGMVYAGGRAAYECMSRDRYDKYYRP